MKQSLKKKISASILLSVLSVFLPVLYLSFLTTSPSTLIKDTTFWFLLINSIVFILAVDSGIFSAPDDNEIYEEFIWPQRSNGEAHCLITEQMQSEENMKVRENSLGCPEVGGECAQNEKTKESSPAEKQTFPASSSVEEESEYSKMSDEELNRRVEDFIRRFKRELSSNR